MEVQGMEEFKKSESHLTSAAAFVEDGVQDACDDACSICLEAFCDSDPSTLTTCKHEFHLQCILEWCQRSSECPMCLQPINLKDPTSQELLESVERERNFRLNPSRNTTIFHHPTLRDFELQHLPVGVHDAELEERILQHLAAAAAMGNSRHVARRAGQRNRSSAQGHPQFLLFSTNPNAPRAASESSSPDERGDGEPAPGIRVALPSPPANVGEESSQSVTLLPSIQVEPQSASTTLTTNQYGFSSNNLAPSQPSPPSQDSSGPSDFQSFSESLKSRFNAMSLRYKESISKSTRDWKEKLFSRNTSMSDLGSEVKREVNAGIATVSHLMELLETRDNNRTDDASISQVKREVNAGIARVSHLMERLETRDNDRTNDASISSRADNAVPDGDNRQISDFGRGHTVSDTNMQASCATGSSSTEITWAIL